jgi:hypothetical protein
LVAVAALVILIGSIAFSSRKAPGIAAQAAAAK